MYQRIMFFFLFSFSTLLFAEGKGYEVLTPAQPVTDQSKVEVLEFFWYGCPHCYHLEPHINTWLKEKPANVNYIRQPAAFRQQWADHAKAYFVAEALGVVDKMHADFFDAIQTKKRKLETEAELADFFAEHGVDRAAFKKTFNSFIIDSKVRKAKTMPPRYGITGVPVLIVNGKYRISSKSAGGQANMIKVLKELIATESSK
jgi:thiol:disulfide interchange protein DsbA